MQYEPVIGLEIHVQVNSNTKLFCRCDNDSFNKEPNTNVCPICMGYPGQLPITNAQAIEKAIKTGLAMNCEIAEFSKFDRKQYFYPDLPTGFQISQNDQPICKKGEITIHLQDGTAKIIRIHRIHVENDAGKLTHTSHGTLCDYNRAGTPLLEIVSEPDMFSIEEASQYAREVQKVVRYIETSFADMEKGHMRFDINVSLKPIGDPKLGTKVEVKNLNSYVALEKALEYEIKRQTEVLNSGEKIVQETRGWDATNLKTISQRLKEEAHDYRYFPEPDIPPIIVKEDEIQAIKQTIPELPRARFERYVSQLNLSEEDARILTEEPKRSEYFEKALSICNDTKLTVSFINTILSKYLTDDNLAFDQSPITATQLGTLLKFVVDGKISNNQAKSEVFPLMYSTSKDAETIIKEQGIEQVSDSGEIEALAKEAIAESPQAVEDFRNGKDRAIAAIIGKVMQKSRGKANPALVDQMVRKLLS